MTNRDCTTDDYHTDMQPDTRTYTHTELQAAVEAALREAANDVADLNPELWEYHTGNRARVLGSHDLAEETILALIPSGPSVLDRVVAEAEARGYRDGWRFAFRQCEATGSVPDPDYAATRAQGDAQRCAECDCQHGGNDCNWIKPAPSDGAENVVLLTEKHAEAIAALEAELAAYRKQDPATGYGAVIPSRTTRGEIGGTRHE